MSDFISLCGFQSANQLQTYLQFSAKIIELLAAEIVARKFSLSVGAFDEVAWQRKILKVYRSMQLMDNHKTSEPQLSKSFQQLAICMKKSGRVSQNASPRIPVSLPENTTQFQKYRETQEKTAVTAYNVHLDDFKMNHGFFSSRLGQESSKKRERSPEVVQKIKKRGSKADPQQNTNYRALSSDRQQKVISSSGKRSPDHQTYYATAAGNLPERLKGVTTRRSISTMKDQMWLGTLQNRQNGVSDMRRPSTQNRQGNSKSTLATSSNVPVQTAAPGTQAADQRPRHLNRKDNMDISGILQVPSSVRSSQRPRHQVGSCENGLIVINQSKLDISKAHEQFMMRSKRINHQ